jgi:hypothetical protein
VDTLHFTFLIPRGKRKPDSAVVAQFMKLAFMMKAAGLSGNLTFGCCGVSRAWLHDASCVCVYVCMSIVVSHRRRVYVVRTLLFEMLKAFRKAGNQADVKEEFAG